MISHPDYVVMVHKLDSHFRHLEVQEYGGCFILQPSKKKQNRRKTRKTKHTSLIKVPRFTTLCVPLWKKLVGHETSPSKFVTLVEFPSNFAMEF